MNAADLRTLKKLIWLYFWLLIFEGVFRKWITPGLSAPLLVVRAPVAMLIYAYALSTGRFPWNGWVVSLSVMSFVFVAIGLVVGPQNPLVAIYGWQCNFLHFPLMFVMARILTFEDVIKFGKWILIICIPMALLVILQFKSSPGSFINRGAGEGALQITVEAGRIRPAGTFSYNLGVTYLYALVTGFSLYRLLIPSRPYPLWLAIGAGFALLGAAATSGSRTFLASIAIVVCMLVIVMTVRPEMAAGIVRILAVGTLAIVILGASTLLQEGVTVMTGRIQRAGKNEGGAVGFAQRFGKGLADPFVKMFDVPLLGHGLGVGTTGGAVLLRGKRMFVLEESEWPRIVAESGPILGTAFIVWRFALVAWLGIASFHQARRGNVLPILLYAGCAVVILQGQLGQPTVRGFAAFGGGLVLAAMQRRGVAVAALEPAEVEGPVVALRGGRMEW